MGERERHRREEDQETKERGGGGPGGRLRRGWQGGDTDWGPGTICYLLFQVHRQVGRQTMRCIEELCETLL